MERPMWIELNEADGARRLININQVSQFIEPNGGGGVYVSFYFSGEDNDFQAIETYDDVFKIIRDDYQCSSS